MIPVQFVTEHSEVYISKLRVIQALLACSLSQGTSLFLLDIFLAMQGFSTKAYVISFTFKRFKFKFFSPYILSGDVRNYA